MRADSRSSHLFDHSLRRPHLAIVRLLRFIFVMLLTLIAFPQASAQANALADTSTASGSQAGKHTLVVWINGDKAYTALAEIGRTFEAATGVRVIVETPENPTDKFVQAARSGGGPDIFFWAHDRIDELADAGLLRPVDLNPAFRSQYLDAGWAAVSHRGRVWGYPVALECVGLIHNKAILPDPPTTLEGYLDLIEPMRARGHRPILFEYGNAYFSWGLLAAGDGYVFGRKPDGSYDLSNVGVDRAGVIEGLDLLVKLVDAGAMARGAGYADMESAMNAGKLGAMVSGPWAWGTLRKNNIDFGVAPLPSVGGRRAKPFIGVLAGLLNRSSDKTDLAIEFLEHYVLTDAGLRAMNDDVPLGVPALSSLADALSSDPLIAGTLANVLQGEPMPNVPEMGRFWSAMGPAIATATNGQATPQNALQLAARQMRPVKE